MKTLDEWLILFGRIDVFYVIFWLVILVVLWPYSWENANRDAARIYKAGGTCRVVRMWYGWTIKDVTSAKPNAQLRDAALAQPPQDAPSSDQSLRGGERVALPPADCSACLGKTPDDAEKQRQMIEWLEKLLAYARGEIKWDTSGVWVDEENQLMPFEMGYWFDVKGCGPGMPPYTGPNASAERRGSTASICNEHPDSRVLSSDLFGTASRVGSCGSQGGAK
jgi:hypothetical protein